MRGQGGGRVEAGGSEGAGWACACRAGDSERKCIDKQILKRHGLTRRGATWHFSQSSSCRAIICRK